MKNPDDGAMPPLTGATRDPRADGARIADAKKPQDAPGQRDAAEAGALLRGLSTQDGDAVRQQAPDRSAGRDDQRALAGRAGAYHDAAASEAAEERPGGGRRKRRKRKRGRKVYAPDGFGRPPAAAMPQATTAGAPPGGGRVASPCFPAGLAGKASAVPAAAARSAGRPFRQSWHRSEAAATQPVYAALDLGTNNCRLLVAVPTRPGQFRVIDAFSRIVRLGEGLTTSGRLSDAAMDRALEALAVCAAKLEGRTVARARLIATEACRAAANGAEFLARVRAETGLELEIIDRQTEARLAVSGCGSLVGPDTRGVVLFDIGGGSSEIALVDLSRGRSPRLADDIVAWTSLPVGVVSLAERFGGRVVTAESFEAMARHVGDLLDRFDGRGRLEAIANGPGFHLLGTSGTVTTLAGVHLGLERYDRRKVDGLWLDEADVGDITDRLLSWSFDERVANACIGPDRADLVLAGCAILEAIRRVWPAKKLRVADRGLREGILSELMAEDGAWRRR